METDVVVDMAEVPLLLHPSGPARLLTHRRLRRVSSSPKLADILARYPDLPMMIDVKHWPAVQPTAAALAHADAVDRVVIGTFSARRTAATVAAIRRLTGKQVRTALTPCEMIRLVFGHGESLTASGSRLIQIPERLATRSFIARAHRFGIWTVAWTVDDERRTVELLRDGIDIVMTNRPSRLARILGDYGLRRF
jgi:glycerophosphoryl diester phosphodiesterase